MNTEYEMHDLEQDDMGELIDQLLRANEIRRAFITRGRVVWINSVSDDFLKAGLRELSTPQIFIIESLMLRDKSITDVCFELGIQYEDFERELKNMRSTLSKYL